MDADADRSVVGHTHRPRELCSRRDRTDSRSDRRNSEEKQNAKRQQDVSLLVGDFWSPQLSRPVVALSLDDTPQGGVYPDWSHFESLLSQYLTAPLLTRNVANEQLEAASETTRWYCRTCDTGVRR